MLALLPALAARGHEVLALEDLGRRADHSGRRADLVGGIRDEAAFRGGGALGEVGQFGDAILAAGDAASGKIGQPLISGAVVEAPVRITATVREGVLVMPKGVWLRHHANGLGVNALTPVASDPVTDGACFNDARVQVRAVARA